MAFSLYRIDMRPRLDLIQQVYASGDITSDTAEKFKTFVRSKNLIPGATVILDSAGGSLLGGMRLGDAIRDARFNTDIGTRGPPQSVSIGEDAKVAMRAMGWDLNPPKKLPGACFSACALAYLGGVHRYLSSGSTYGVHRFTAGTPTKNDLDAAQIISAMVVQYIAKMGVDAALFGRMSEAGPTSIRVLNRDELFALRVATGSVLRQDWTLKSVPGEIYLVGTRVDERGVSKMLFACDRKNRKVTSMVYIPEGSEADARLVVKESVDAGYFVDDEIHRIGKRALSTAEKAEVFVVWPASRADIAAITSAKTNTGFALLPAMNGIFFGLQLDFGENGRAMIRNYATDCWGSAVR
jgi:hypothetical protein